MRIDFSVGAMLWLGMYAQVAQAVLIREFLSIFHGNELAIGLFLGSWLFWIGVGGWLAIILERRGFSKGNPWRWVPWLACLPWLLAVLIVVIRLLRQVWVVPVGQWPGLGALFVSTTLLVLPIGLFLGILFPLACRAVSSRQEEPVTRLFVAEAAGALTGSALATVVFMFWPGPLHMVALLWLPLSLLPWITPGFADDLPKWSRGLSFVGGIAGLWFLTPFGTGVNDWLDGLRFHSLHPGLQRVAGVETRHGLMELATLEREHLTINDGAITASFPPPPRTLIETAWTLSQVEHPDRVLQIGGFHQGITRALLDSSVQHLQLLLEDAQGFETLKPHLPPQQRATLADARLKLAFGDGRVWVRQATGRETFDLVSINTGDPTSVRHNRFHTLEFFQSLVPLLSAGGVVCTRIGGAANYLGQEVAGLGASVWATLGAVFSHRVVVPGDELLFCAANHPLEQDPARLYQRFSHLNPSAPSIPEVAFLDLLPPKRIAFTRERLARPDAEINTDSVPASLYYNLVLWSRFTASESGRFLSWLKSLQGWPHALPSLLVAGMLIASRNGRGSARRSRDRKNTALFSLGSFGFVTMAIQLVILLSFQMKVGVIFSRIALINGLFMTGLVVGATWVGRWLVQRGVVTLGLAGIHLGMGVFSWFLPQWLEWGGEPWQEPLHYSFAVLTGIMGGAVFPLGVAMVHGRQRLTGVTSGLVQAWDHWGGAMGAWVAGLIMIPVLGTTLTAHLASFMILLGLVALGSLHLPQSWYKTGPGRAPSFPWQGSIRILLIITLSVGLLTALARHQTTKQSLTFNESLLADLSGSHHFQTLTDPWPHHLGRENSTSNPDTVILSSLTVAADIRGYAGPLHLLIAIDKGGVLRGIRLIHSRETPAYVEGLLPWLERFKGIGIDDPQFALMGLDGLSGATITREAARSTIEKTARHGLHQTFGRPLAGERRPGWSWPPLSFWSAMILLMLAAAVYFGNRDRERLLLEVAMVTIPGFAFNLPWTELDLVNLTLGHVGGWEHHQAWWLIGGVALLTALLAGPVHCGLICPFGALQSLISRLGMRLGLMNTLLHPTLERLGRFWKYLLLALILVTVWIGDDPRWASFNPMQRFFSLDVEPRLLPLTAISLAAALIFYRYWCRYWCPMGAFLALGNRLAWFNPFVPKRVFRRCDLGAKHEYHVDCIRCGRCSQGSRIVQPVRTWGGRELGFGIIMLLTAVCVVYHLKFDSRDVIEGGWRRIETDRVRHQIDTGRLSGEPGSWFHLRDEKSN